MQKLIEITKDQTIQVSSQVLNFDKPDYVYIPIKPEAKLYVKRNTAVVIGTPLFKLNEEFVTSPVSGTVKEITNINTINGLRNALMIQNDFKEKNLTKSAININFKKIKKENLNEILATFNVDLTKKKELILSCIDDEPYVLTESFYLFLYFEGFLEILDKLSQIYNLNITICVKSSNSENINKLLECLGMYPNINLRIIPNLYLLGNSLFLLKYLNLNKDDSTLLKASVFYEIYNIIERNKIVGDKLLTITGNGLTNPSIIKVKIGTKVNDIITNLIQLKEEPLIYILNGLMTGIEQDIDDLVVTKDLNSIFIMRKINKVSEEKCINCGACLDICPVNINPLLLNNPEYFARVKSKCLKCGLCSYICPSHINFNKYLNKGEENE